MEKQKQVEITAAATRLPGGSPAAKEHANPGLARARRSPLPAAVDDGEVRARADVLYDVGVFFAGDVQGGVVGLAHRQEVGRLVPRGQLDDVCDEGRGTQAEHVDTCARKGRTVTRLAPSAMLVTIDLQISGHRFLRFEEIVENTLHF